MKIVLINLLISLPLIIYCHEEFTPDQCLAAHNELRRLHVDTQDIVYSQELERDAQIYADQLKTNDNSVDIRPTRVLPKRKKRHINNNGIDPNKHLESWDGEIFYPQGSWNRNNGRKVKIGENIHKFCCYSFPHCPKQFFHNLLFPPSASGVVKDWYNQELGDYDFKTGEKKTTFSQIQHFASIVWKKTTKIGCAQSIISSSGCVYTVVLYEEEGATGDIQNFKDNIGTLLSSVDDSSTTLIIFLIVFFIILIIGIVAFCYCCKERIQHKYLQIKIKTDTMKAEQELDTDSTRFWWLRLFKRRRKAQRRRTTVSRPRHVSVKERPTIEVIPNSAPIRTAPPPPRMRGQSNAGSIIRYQGISQKPQTMLVRDNYGYDAQKSLPLIPKAGNGANQHTKMARVPSLSGKAPPPPVPSNPDPIYGNINPPVAPQPIRTHPRPPVARMPNNTPDEKPSGPMKRPPQPLSKSPSNPIKPSVAKTPSNPLKPITTSKPKPFIPASKPSPKPVLRPVSVPVNQTTRPQPVPRKNTVPIEFDASQTKLKQQSPGTRGKPLLPPLKPVPKQTSNTSNEDESQPTKSVAEMRKFLENR